MCSCVCIISMVPSSTSDRDQVDVIGIIPHPSFIILILSLAYQRLLLVLLLLVFVDNRRHFDWILSEREV
jgi:hypothetical protein